MTKRKKNGDGDEEDSFSESDKVNEKVRPGSSKRYIYNLSNPSKFELKKVLGNVNSVPELHETFKQPSLSSSEQLSSSILKQKFQPPECCRISRKNKYVGPALIAEFKTASGRPLVKDVLPVTTEISDVEKDKGRQVLGGRCMQSMKGRMNNALKREGWKADDSLKHFDDNIIDIIEAEIMSQRSDIKWTDIVGLEATKKALKEIIVLPFMRPDIFTGIRAPPKGVLLFGPPGTGKTMIGRCVASQCNATFFNIAASSITSKWVGEGEKLVRALFTIARVLQPSIVFIDEIDSLLTSRCETDHESSRRIKTEFLIHLDGVATTAEERILILGATNRPQELESAVKRRFAKRLYIDLPCDNARAQMIQTLLLDQKHELSNDDVSQIAKLTDGYSGADMKQLCAEAAMAPVRNIVDSSSLDIASINVDDIRPICFADFKAAIRFVRPTVAHSDLEGYQEWNKQYGSFVPE